MLNIVASEIPAGKQVSVLYTGSYEKMEEPYNELTKWFTEQGYIPSGTAYEFYLNSPQEVAPEALQTIIMFPVK